MLNLTALGKVLSAVLSPPRLHTAVLLTPSGDLIAHATCTGGGARPKDRLRVLVGIASEVWLEVGHEGVGMVESELGKILVLPLRPPPSPSPSSSPDPTLATDGDPPLLVALNGLDEIEWADMQVKAQGVANCLAAPIIEFGDRLLPTPPRNGFSERYYGS